MRADYFDGRSSQRHEVTLGFRDGAIWVEGDFGRRSAKLEQTVISEYAGRGLATIQFPDGAVCEIRDGAAFAAQLAAAGVAVSPVSLAEQRWPWALAALAGALLVILAGYRFALPWIAASLAPAIPAAVTQSISAAVLKGLDSQLLSPSKLPERRQQELAAKVAELAHAGSQPSYRLLFRSAPALGPNAFALPGGEVVVLDRLVALARRDENVRAVVAHELGHLRHHHGMRQLIQSSVVSFVVGVYLGDISTVAAGLTALVLDSRYSREFEREADAYAAQSLLAMPDGLDPLIEMLQRLEHAHGERRAAEPGGLFDLLSSHPNTAERIAALRALAKP